VASRKKQKTARQVSPRVAQKRERVREEILAAARAVIVRDGLAAATLGAVADELGLTKAALYYYFPSKDALLNELMYRSMEQQSQSLHDAVEETETGPEALRALIRETVEMYADRLDDFRLQYLQPQLNPDAVQVSAEQLARIRPLNELAYAGAAERVAKGKRGRAGVDPRMMAFLANMAATGVLTIKGLVETFDDPLLYSDEELIDALAKIFEAAAKP
jgi:AcrR family transcriptional regulator